jgi:hypothetical protein
LSRLPATEAGSSASGQAQGFILRARMFDNEINLGNYKAEQQVGLGSGF